MAWKEQEFITRIDLCRQNMAGIEEAIAYNFENRKLLSHALTHASFVRIARTNSELLSCTQNGECNERLEFLGDAVLDLVISNCLFLSLQEDSEGDLSKKRAALVCEAALAEKAKDIYLHTAMLVGPHEFRDGLHLKDAVLADALEAVIAAVYLDGGHSACEAVVKMLFAKDLKNIRFGVEERDFKTHLQEMLQAEYKTVPEYETTHISGEAHDPEFEVAVKFRDRTLAIGKGKSKKKASQIAARAVWEDLQNGNLEIKGLIHD